MTIGAFGKALTLPVVDLFLRGSHSDVATILGRLETQPWSPIDALVRFGLCRRARGVKGGFFLHRGSPVGATHA